jgi:hypothetical protein
MASSVSPGSSSDPFSNAPGGIGPGFVQPLKVGSEKFTLERKYFESGRRAKGAPTFGRLYAGLNQDGSSKNQCLEKTVLQSRLQVGAPVVPVFLSNKLTKRAKKLLNKRHSANNSFWEP